MRKHIIIIIVGILLSFQPCFAGTTNFPVSMTVPSASSISLALWSVNSSSGLQSPVSGSSLNFDPMVYQPANGIYQPDHYFYITSVPNGSVSNQDFTVSYTEGANPNGAGHGLGWKVSAAFNMRVGPITETSIPGHATKKLLKDLVTPEHITSTQIGSNPIVLYVGVVDDPSRAPVGAEVVSNADKSGLYNGTLTVTATVS